MNPNDAMVWLLHSKILGPPWNLAIPLNLIFCSGPPQLKLWGAATMTTQYICSLGQKISTNMHKLQKGQNLVPLQIRNNIHGLFH